MPCIKRMHLQSEAAECGLACLATIAGHHGLRVDLRDLRRRFSVSLKGATLAHLMRSADFLWTAERAIDWQKPWDGYTMTRYGRKAEREGRVAAYLRFRRVS